jgi:hypothetical protein
MKKIIVLLCSFALVACHQQEIVPTTSHPKFLTLDDKRVLILVDGKQVTNAGLQAVDPNTIDLIEVIKNQEEIKKYTSTQYEGIVKIYLKK